MIVRVFAAIACWIVAGLGPLAAVGLFVTGHSLAGFVEMALGGMAGCVALIVGRPA